MSSRDEGKWFKTYVIYVNILALTQTIIHILTPLNAIDSRSRPVVSLPVKLTLLFNMCSTNVHEGTSTLSHFDDPTWSFRSIIFYLPVLENIPRPLTVYRTLLDSVARCVGPRHSASEIYFESVFRVVQTLTLPLFEGVISSLVPNKEYNKTGIVNMQTTFVANVNRRPKSRVGSLIRKLMT